MNNFLNTSYRPYKYTIVFGNLRNSHEEIENPYIVYCDPEYIPLSKLSDFLDGCTSNSYKNYLTFRSKKLSQRKLNLFLIFNALSIYLNDNSVNSINSIDIQKSYFPFYNNIILKTVYWNVLSYNNVMDQLNSLYETTQPITYDNILNLESLITGESPKDLRIEINYDYYCPYFKNTIRFVFQYLFKISNI